MTSDLEVKELGNKMLFEIVVEVACFTRRDDENVHLSVQLRCPSAKSRVLQATVTAVWKHVAHLLSTGDSATNRYELVFAALSQTLIDIDVLQKQESALERLVNGLKVKPLTSNFECIYLRSKQPHC